MPDSGTVFDRLSALLSSQGVTYEVLRHTPVYSSAEAAAVRGTPLASGAKALVCRADGHWVMFVIPADLKLARRPQRGPVRIRSLRFANRDEVQQLTGLPPGAIPPFGSLFELPTLCDSRLGQHERINFNAGDNAISVNMRYDDYLKVERPELGAFAE